MHWFVGALLLLAGLSCLRYGLTGASGFGAAVGNGLAHDFLLVIDRVDPRIDTFAFTIAGKAGAIWWMPTHTEARFASHGVPEPGGMVLAGAALGALGLVRRRQRGSSATSEPASSASQA